MSVAVIADHREAVKRLPGYIVALVLGTIVVVLFKLPVETIGTRFGGIPSGPPHLQFRNFTGAWSTG